MPFRLAPTELIIVLVIIMMVVGVGKLPDVGRSLGKTLREFRSAQSSIEIIDEEPAVTESKPKPGEVKS